MDSHPSAQSWFACRPAHLQPESGSERAQALVRLRCGALLFAVFLLLQWSGLDVKGAPWVMLAYTLFAYAWIFVVSREALPQKHRICCALAGDNLILASGFYFGGGAFVLGAWALIIFSTGYGLRFGKRYAIRSIILSCVCSGVAFILSPYWRDNSLMVMGIMACLIIPPGYTAHLAEIISGEKRQVEQKAAYLDAITKVDPLTGLLNRRGLLACMDALPLDPLQHWPQRAVIFIDLDNFKKINDIAGHAAGDAVLRQVGEAISHCLRQGDHVSRFGGDEFVALVNQLEADLHAREIAGRILQRIRRITVEGQGALFVGASIGVCRFPSSLARDAETALNKADSFMYMAKNAGKNCVFSSADLKEKVG